MPIIDLHRRNHLLLEVDGNQSIECVYKEIEKGLYKWVMIILLLIVFA